MKSYYFTLHYFTVTSTYFTLVPPLLFLHATFCTICQSTSGARVGNSFSVTLRQKNRTGGKKLLPTIHPTIPESSTVGTRLTTTMMHPSDEKEENTGLFGAELWCREAQTVDDPTVLTLQPSFSYEEDDVEEIVFDEQGPPTEDDAARAQEQWPEQHKAKHLLRRQLIRRLRRLLAAVLLVCATFSLTWLTLNNRTHIAHNYDKANNNHLDDAIEFLSLARVSNIHAFQNETSPQQLAIEWLMLEDGLRPVPRSFLGNEALLFVQRYSMAVLFFSAGGPDSWKHRWGFLSASHECEWHTDDDTGVRCNDDNIVTAINLPQSGLRGQLPLEFFEFRGLTHLSLANNELEGDVQPLERFWESLSQLVSVDLSMNKFSGSLPLAFASLPSLRSLNLRGNQFSGNVTADFVSKLVNITLLDLQANNLTGTLPNEMVKLSHLRYLAFGHNDFAFRTLPSWLWYLTQLQVLSAGGLNLSGELPTGLRQLRSLKFLDLSENAFVGDIPVTLWNAPHLSYIFLHDNALDGQVLPSANVLGADKLQVVTLFDNPLTGSLQAICDEGVEMPLLGTDCTIQCGCCDRCCASEDEHCFQEELEEIFDRTKVSTFDAAVWNDSV